jgi:hypothetical protein
MAALKIQATTRVPEAFIPPLEPWPKHPIPITLKNLADFSIQYSYSEDGVRKDGILMENQIAEKPTMFFLNTPYMFNLKTGRRIEPTQ